MKYIYIFESKIFFESFLCLSVQSRIHNCNQGLESSSNQLISFSLSLSFEIYFKIQCCLKL